MQEGQLLMTQADRDRLVTLKKAKKKLITQREAAEELGISVRQVKRLLYALKKLGEKTRDRSEQRDGAAVDDAGQAVAGEKAAGEGGPHVAAAAEPVWRTGAVGHQ
jgi:biotin operon repressor